MVNPHMFFLSPLLMTFLLRYVSGVPPLEIKAAKHPEWAAYEAVTPVFFPGIPGKYVAPAVKESEMSAGTRSSTGSRSTSKSGVTNRKK